MDISVAICTYNNCRLLQRTLETLTALTSPDGVKWELVVVDNNSTDRTRQVAEEFAGRLPLRYVQEPIQGLSQARRRAVRETTAPLIAFVDDDCLVPADWLEQTAAFCRDHPQAGAVGGRVELVWEVPPDPVVRQYDVCLARQDHGDVPCRLPSEGYTYLVGAGLVVRREALQASGWMEHGALSDRRGRALSSGGDSEMVLRIRGAGYELWYNPAMRMGHWIPKRRMSLSYLCRLQRGMGQSQVFLDALATQQPATLARRVRTLGSSLGRLARAGKDVLVDLRWFRKVRPEQRIALYHAWGYLEGSLALLWHGYRV